MLRRVRSKNQMPTRHRARGTRIKSAGPRASRGAPRAIDLRKQTAKPLRFLDSSHAENERGQSHRDRLLAREGQDLGESVFENAKESVDHFGFGPKKALQILNPFEVGNDYAPRIAENVRD